MIFHGHIFPVDRSGFQSRLSTSNEERLASDPGATEIDERGRMRRQSRDKKHPETGSKPPPQEVATRCKRRFAAYYPRATGEAKQADPMARPMIVQVVEDYIMKPAGASEEHDQSEVQIYANEDPPLCFDVS